MSCYICLEEQVHTPDIGTCAHCSLHACGKPPQRRDLLFHGDVCAIHGCGVFYCERHLHRHPHTSHGRSNVFPAIAFSSGVRVVAAGAALEGAQDPRPELASNKTYRDDINRYLNIIAPGSDALRDLQDMIPEDMSELVEAKGGTAVHFLPQFFTRAVLSAVSRMALRSVWISAAALSPAARVHEARVREARAHLSQWVGSLGVPDVLSRVDLDANETAWVVKVVRQLPAGSAVKVDIGQIPPESEPTELARFFLSERNEGLQMASMEAF